MADVRRLEIQVNQTGNAQAGVQKLSGGFGKLGAMAGPAGLAVTAAAAGITAIGVGAFKVGKQLIGMASDAEEMLGKFNVVFGEAAPTATAALDEFGNEVGRSTFELQEMASTVQDTFVPLGFARTEAAGMSVELTKLAVDMGSFNNVADAQVMQDLQSAIVGNHETMRKYGVIITQATLDQELLRMGVEGGTKAATEQEKVQARLNIIMAGTSDAQGDAARTSGSWANQMRALKATFSEAGTTIGTELLPLVTPLLKKFTDLMRDILPKLIEVFKTIMKTMRDQLGPAFKEIWEAVKEVGEALGFGEGKVDVLKIALDVIVVTIKIAAEAFKFVAKIIKGVARGVKTLSDALDRLKRKWNDMKEAARRAIDAIPHWLRPGSPTPFEMGLRGIADAASKIDLGMGTTGLVGAPAMAGGGITVNLYYNPAVSLANQYEAERVLAPYIAEALRKRV
jgi:hypothetical protein